MYATDVQKKCGNAERIINEFILPLYDDFDLISFRDNKENNLLHCCLKTFQAKENFTLNFFNSGKVNEFVPKDLDPVERKKQLNKLVDAANKEGFNPFEIAMAS
jgi:hypothetical protein